VEGDESDEGKRTKSLHGEGGGQKGLRRIVWQKGARKEASVLSSPPKKKGEDIAKERCRMVNPVKKVVKKERRLKGGWEGQKKGRPLCVRKERYTYRRERKPFHSSIRECEEEKIVSTFERLCLVLRCRERERRRDASIRPNKVRGKKLYRWGRCHIFRHANKRVHPALPQ